MSSQLQFKANKSYTYGILHKAEEERSYTPMFMKKPPQRTYQGNIFHASGVRTIEDLMKNPQFMSGYNNNCTVHIYENVVDKEGAITEQKLIGKSSPLLPSVNSAANGGLSDANFMSPNLPQPTAQEPKANNRSEAKYLEMISTSVDGYRRRCEELEKRVQELIDSKAEMEIDMRQQINNLEVEKHKLQIEVDTLHEVMKNTQASGLSDPATQEVIANIIGPLAQSVFPALGQWLGTKLNGIQPPQPQAQPMQTPAPAQPQAPTLGDMSYM